MVGVGKWSGVVLFGYNGRSKHFHVSFSSGVDYCVITPTHRVCFGLNVPVLVTVRVPWTGLSLSWAHRQILRSVVIMIMNERERKGCLSRRRSHACPGNSEHRWLVLLTPLSAQCYFMSSTLRGSPMKTSREPCQKKSPMMVSLNISSACIDELTTLPYVVDG